MRPDDRLEALRRAPSDSWVAIASDESRVVAYGRSYDEAVAEAEKVGELDPILVKVPTDWTELVLQI